MGFTMVLPWKDRDSAGEGSQLSTFFHAIPPWPRRPVASRATKMHWVKSFLGRKSDRGRNGRVWHWSPAVRLRCKGWRSQQSHGPNPNWLISVSIEPCSIITWMKRYLFWTVSLQVLEFVKSCTYQMDIGMYLYICIQISNMGRLPMVPPFFLGNIWIAIASQNPSLRSPLDSHGSSCNARWPPWAVQWPGVGKPPKPSWTIWWTYGFDKALRSFINLTVTQHFLHSNGNFEVSTISHKPRYSTGLWLN